MNEGILFDIEHGSFVDGPGVRTVVFFKGCNLKCNWCHNPESQNAIPEMMFFENTCKNCGICKIKCPNGQEFCDLCGTCTKYCPTGARRICGRKWTIDEVIREIQRDLPFFNSSNGGVTFSGGECMLQIGFLKSLLIRCNELGIHTAVDTAGNVEWENFEEIMPYTDMFLYDVKCFSEELHKKGTGVSNKKILENLVKLSNAFTGDIIIRIPIIPEFNTDELELKKMSKFIKNIKHKKLELLPYHKLGENKSIALGRKEKTYSIPSNEDIEKIKLIFK